MTAHKKSHPFASEEKILSLAIGNDVFRSAVQNAFNHIIITDTDGVVIYANSAVERITGYPIDEVIGQTPKLWGGQMESRVYEELWHTVKVEKKPYRNDLINKRKDGTLYHARAVISPIIDPAGTLIGFIGTEEDITKEKEVDKMKSEFISITAHQLLTPLAGMKWGYAQLRKEMHGTSEEILTHLEEGNQRLIDLVTALLNITRLESGRLSITPESMDMDAVLRRMVESMTDASNAKQQTIHLQVAAGLPALSSDPQLVWEVLKNLLSNAVKYTPEGGRIDVRAEQEGNAITVAVTDTGIGIPADAQTKLFQKYFRADNARDLTADGTGLGLYFVKMIVDLMGGTISCESTPGTGTTFRVSIPLSGLRERKGEVRLS